MNYPEMIRIRQRFERVRLDPISSEIQSQIENLVLKTRVTRKQTVAVACSSRGIANYPTITAAVVSALKQMGLVPFVIPAMGSH